MKRWAVTRRVPRRQPGQVIGLAVGVMVAMLAAVALVVDAGFFLVARRELSNTADGAALAAVHALRPSNPMNPGAGIDGASLSAADAAAHAIVVANTVGSDTGAGRLCNAEPVAAYQEAVKPMDGGGVIYTYAVTLDCEVGFTAGRVLGLLTMPIRGSATAAVGSAAKVDCPLPVAIVDPDGNIANGVGGYTFNALRVLWTQTPSMPGIWRAIDFDGFSGGGELRERLAGDCAETLSVDQPVYTETGALDTPLELALRDRGFVASGPGGSPTLTCPQTFAEVYDVAAGALRSPTSRCLGLVPVIHGPYPSGQSQPIDLLGFAVVFMVQYTSSPKQLTGYYIQAPVQAELGAYNSAGTIVHRLIR